MLATGQRNLRELLDGKQDNHRYLTMIFRAEMVRGQVMMALDKWAEAEEAFTKASKGMMAQYEHSMEASDTKNWILTSKTLGALAMAKQGRLAAAADLMDRVVREVEETPARLLHSTFGRKMLSVHANARAELAELQGNADLARSLRLQMISRFAPKWQQSHPVVRFELMKAYMAVGRIGDASEVAGNLHEIGFLRADFREADKALARMKLTVPTLPQNAHETGLQSETR